MSSLGKGATQSITHQVPGPYEPPGFHIFHATNVFVITHPLKKMLSIRHHGERVKFFPLAMFVWRFALINCRFQDLEAWANAGFAWLRVLCRWLENYETSWNQNSSQKKKRATSLGLPNNRKMVGSRYPYNSCMTYLPTYTWLIFMVNVYIGRYTILYHTYITWMVWGSVFCIFFEWGGDAFQI